MSTEPGCEQSVTNLPRVTPATDNVFSDGVSLQMPQAIAASRISEDGAK